MFLAVAWHWLKQVELAQLQVVLLIARRCVVVTLRVVVVAAVVVRTLRGCRSVLYRCIEGSSQNTWSFLETRSNNISTTQVQRLHYSLRTSKRQTMYSKCQKRLVRKAKCHVCTCLCLGPLYQKYTGMPTQDCRMIHKFILVNDSRKFGNLWQYYYPLLEKFGN